MKQGLIKLLEHDVNCFRSVHAAVLEIRLFFPNINKKVSKVCIVSLQIYITVFSVCSLLKEYLNYNYF